MVFGAAPDRVTGWANLGETGVDEQAVISLGYPEGGMAALTCAIRTNTQQTAHIYGTEGAIHLPHPFWCGTRVTLAPSGGEPETVEFEHKANGYEYQAEEVAACLADGRLESSVMPWEESIHVMDTLDQLRAQWGLRYPNE